MFLREIVSTGRFFILKIQFEGEFSQGRAEDIAHAYEILALFEVYMEFFGIEFGGGFRVIPFHGQRSDVVVQIRAGVV